MATAQYYAWNRDGRPLTPAQPIRDIVDRLRVAYPRGAAAHLFSWYADDAHYQAAKPQDHTPYSYTPWPVTPNPYPVVFATDIMHRPDLGVDCQPLFDYWIAEARAGRMPWLKYLIWQGRSYDVRTGWVPKTATGHYDHIHISTRTDHKDTSLGAWVLVPGTADGGDDDVTLIAQTGQTGTNVKRVQEKHREVDPSIPASYVDSQYGPTTTATHKRLLGVGDGTKCSTGDEAWFNTVLLKRAGTGGGLTEAQVAAIAEDVAEQEIADATITLTPTE